MHSVTQLQWRDGARARARLATGRRSRPEIPVDRSIDHDASAGRVAWPPHDVSCGQITPEDPPRSRAEGRLAIAPCRSRSGDATETGRNCQPRDRGIGNGVKRRGDRGRVGPRERNGEAGEGKINGVREEERTEEGAGRPRRGDVQFLSHLPKCTLAYDQAQSGRGILYLRGD